MIIVSATSKQINYLKRLSNNSYSKEQLSKLTKLSASELIQAWIGLNNACANINCIPWEGLDKGVKAAEVKAFGYTI